MTDITVALSYDVAGPAGAPAIVLLNSIGTSREIWDAQREVLSEQFCVIRLDARGHGRSPAAPGKSTAIADLGRDVLAVLDRLDLARVHLTGLSLGGMTAMWIAVNHPARVDRLALLCTSAHPGNAESWRTRADAVRSGGFEPIADSIVARWTTPEFAAAWPAVLHALRADLAGSDPESYAQCCELLATLDLRGDLHRITAPTLVIGADRDQALPMAHSAAIASSIAGSRLVEIAPAAHIPTVERPDVITRQLLEHVAAEPVSVTRLGAAEAEEG